MKKQDFELMHEVALVVPKIMKMSVTMFNATICSTISTYAHAHNIEIEELLATAISTLLCDELDFDEEGDNDKE